MAVSATSSSYPSCSSSSSSVKFGPIFCPYTNPRRSSLSFSHVVFSLSSSSSSSSSSSASSGESSRPSLRVSANPNSRARFSARRKESVLVRQLQRPLSEYMSLPASQYSVLDAERIERVDDNTFRCYVYRIKFFAFEVCPVLLVRVEEQPKGCCIKLLSCKLEGSPIVAAQNDKFDDTGDGEPVFMPMVILDSLKKDAKMDTGVSILDEQTSLSFFQECFDIIWCGHAAFMENKISCDSNERDLSEQKLTSEAVIEVSIEIPFAFRPIPVQAIESTGAQVLEQVLRIMLPRFMAQLVKDYQAWASGDTSRQPLGTGKI